MRMIFNGLSGITASQIALNNVSHNLNNMKTPFHTKQGVLLSSKNSLNGGSLSGGMGVKATGLIRYSDNYKTQKLWQSNSGLGQFQAAKGYLNHLENIMGDVDKGIGKSLDDFFASLNAVSPEPASMPLRQQVIEKAKNLGLEFGQLKSAINIQRKASELETKGIIKQVNSYLSEIASLNKKIVETKNIDGDISGLQDQRDYLIDNLSGLINVKTTEQNDGSINISLKNGSPLIVGKLKSDLEIKDNILYSSFGTEKFELPTEDLQGTLGGLFSVNREVFDKIENSINNMAKIVAEETNKILTKGYGVSGDEKSPPLFIFNENKIENSLTINNEITADKLGFSSKPNLAGNSDNLNELIKLKDKKFEIKELGNNVLLMDIYPQLVGKLGSLSKQNLTSFETAEIIRNQAQNDWNSTSGINTDEEAINLMEYTQMYQANMKVIATANTLFDNLLALR